MTPVTITTATVGGGILSVTINDAGATVSISGDSVAANSSVNVSKQGSREVATAWDGAEDVRDLEMLTALQGSFETEMGADLMAYNSQALVKDANRVYVQAVTRLAFEAYQKGLDGLPV